MEQPQTCAACRHFRNEPLYPGTGPHNNYSSPPTQYGQCLRFPPTAMPMPKTARLSGDSFAEVLWTEDDAPVLVAFYPAVKNTPPACGEATPKP